MTALGSAANTPSASPKTSDYRTKLQPASPNSRRPTVLAGSPAPVEPVLSETLLERSHQELQEAEELVETILGEKTAMHQESKEWHDLNDPGFTARLQESARLILELDAQHREAVKLRNYRHSVNEQVLACWAAQLAKEARQAAHAKRAEEVRIAAVREQEASELMGAARDAESEQKLKLKEMTSAGPGPHVSIVLHSRLG